MHKVLEIVCDFVLLCGIHTFKDLNMANDHNDDHFGMFTLDLAQDIQAQPGA